MKKKIGYTTGVFDMFHIGHLNILRQAKENCDYLIVGVSTDELTYRIKGKYPVIPFEQRVEIVKAIKYVDEVVPEETIDKYYAWERLHYDVLFKGSDALNKAVYKKIEAELKEVGAVIQFFPYTEGISSSKLRIDRRREMKVDKDYCMSSYLTFRYVDSPEILFKEGLLHRDHELIKDTDKYACSDAKDIDYFIRKILSEVDLSKAAICLSGGMDSAILASYMPKGTKAYTARCVAESAVDETEMAKKYCDIYGLEHVIVDVTWYDYLTAMDELMLADGSPIIPNEPQAYMMAKKIAEDGAQIVIYGDCADTEFGGMDRLLSKDWKINDFVERFTFVDPKKALRNPIDVSEVYERYRLNEDDIDYIKFISEVYAKSAAGALTNAYEKVGLSHVDPYEKLKMANPLDLNRVRNGEPKYLIRELFKMRYPMLDIPEKLPMSRPANEWLKTWEGPKRPEFIPGCEADMTGEQKLLVYSLEKFLNLIEG